mgnify:CR=1 FL=1
MKRRRVVKLFSLGMAGMLAVSSCNIAGSVVNAEEITVQEGTQEDVVKEGEDLQKDDEAEKKGEQESSVAEETTEQKSKSDESSEEVVEGTTEEVTENVVEGTTEEVTEEVVEETTEAVAEDVVEVVTPEETEIVSEEVELKQIYGGVIAFDTNSDGDCKGESYLRFSTEEELHSGASITLDLYIPEEAADYNGQMKVEGFARAGICWETVVCEEVLVYEAADFAETVEVEGKLYKKAKATFTFGDAIDDKNIADFVIKITGCKCDFLGSVYCGNIKAHEVQTTMKQFYESDVIFDSTSSWDDKGEQHLGLKSDVALTSGTKVSFDMYIPEKNADFNGVIKVQGVARLGDNWDWTQNATIPEFTSADFTETVKIAGKTYKKANVSFTFGDEITADYLAEFTVKLAGWMCDYEGAIYYDNVVLEAATQEIVLNQFYGEDVVFDATSEWDDKGEHQLGLSNATALNSGAKVSFDVLVPAEADYSGVIKFQGVARLGDNWDWTENSVIPELSSDAFTKTVEIDGTTYKMANVSYTFGDEITADRLAEFTVKLAGWMCDYEGPIYYANVNLENGAGSVESNVLYAWDFATDIDGWYYDGTWQNDGDNSIEWNEQYEALQMNVDYSLNADSTWSEIKSSFWGDEFYVEGVNKITFDFIYDAAALQTGMFKAKAFSNSGVNIDVNINTNLAEEYDGTLMKVPVSLSFDESDIENGITIGIIGYENDYQGVVYLDNITLMSEVSEEADFYVDSTVAPIGQALQLAVEGNTLVTGAGSSEIAQNITLVDANATDDVKQVYAYLQAVGQTDSVIFGQQNNTSHKAGNSNLSNSDTMDVVGSYAGVIGIDGLSLAGDEYSAVRYLNEMDGVDSEYATVAAKIQAASTVAEQNVIAAAALTNFNIRNGAIATLSIHAPNFSKVNAVETTDSAPSYAGYDFTGYTSGNLTGDVMNNILPGGAYNAAFTAYLDMVADYAKQVDGAILFRPFHENTGSWFWWGAALCDAQTYKSVFKYTVEYLRDEKGVHNLLYVYGPGSEAANVEEYAVRYPGDGYVDMVGFDMYHDNPTQGDSFISNFTKELSVVESFAKAHGKLVAVTETGVRNDVQDGDNEHLAKKQGDWYMFTRYTKQLNIIFKTGKGWTGSANQTEDLKTDRSGCYILTQEGDKKAKFTEVDCE